MKKWKHQTKREKDKILKRYRFKLSQRATPAEKHIKRILRSNNITFEFQKPIDVRTRFYIVDFYFPHEKLIIELDGSSHRGKYWEDKKRTIKLVKRGYKVVRLFNSEALKMDYHTLKDFILGFYTK